MTDDYDEFTKRMTSFDLTLDEDVPLAQSDTTEGGENDMIQNDADDFLEHYGVKGMKWGQRKAARIEKKAKEKYERSSEDARQAESARTKMKTSSVDSLSNKELQSLVQRMNLEQQLSGLQEKTKTKSAGRKFAEDIARELAKETLKSAVKNSVGIEVQGAMEKQLTKGVNKSKKKAKEQYANLRNR